MTNTQHIETFYTAFVEGNAQAMTDCYHPDVVFQDPAFGRLESSRAIKMWQMLLSNKSAAPQISFSNVTSSGDQGSAEWRAEYFYGPKKRKVVNHVQAVFALKEGKIIEHIDTFNLWKWSRQALGPVGTLIGWTPLMKAKVQKIANGKLDDYIQKTK